LFSLPLFYSIKIIIILDMRKRSSKKPSDKPEPAPNESAGEGEPTPEEQPQATPQGKNPAAVALGKLGGAKGGPARAKKLTKEQRSEIAKKAAIARWKKK
jgi:hypothetical protein